MALGQPGSFIPGSARLTRLRGFRVNHMILDAFPRRKLRWQTCEAAGLPNSAILCDCCLMNSYRFISRLLAVLVIAGLVATPLVAPAAAKRLPVAVTMDMPGMAADMPCCPDKHHSNNCQDCPLVALCMLTVAQAEPSSVNGILAPRSTRTLLFIVVDVTGDGLIGVPPDHPPRIST